MGSIERRERKDLPFRHGMCRRNVLLDGGAHLPRLRYSNSRPLTPFASCDQSALALSTPFRLLNVTSTRSQPYPHHQRVSYSRLNGADEKY